MEQLGLVALAGFALVEWVTKGMLTRGFWTLAISSFAALEAAATRVVQLVRPPRFVITGSCYRCGDCCRMIVANPPRLLHKYGLLRLFAAYHRLAHGFVVTARGPAGEVIFSCMHLRADRRCGIYKRRPLLCRNYPVLPFFETPRVMPACSYSVAPRAVALMKTRASLPIVNPGVTVHHPTRPQRGTLGQSDDYEWLDDSPN